MTDRRILYAAAFLRALAVGLLGVLLGLHLARLHVSDAGIGWIIAAGLVGGALATLFVTVRGDRLGRRRSLLVLAALSTVGAAALALSSDAWLAGAAAFVGMANAVGRDRSAMLVLDSAILPSTASDAQRTRAFAWYNVCQDAGAALGALLAGLPDWLRAHVSVGDLPASRIGLGIPALLTAVVAVLYLRLSPAVESRADGPAAPLAPRSRRRLWGISSLFALDSLGGGLLGRSLLSIYFVRRFDVSEGAVATLFFWAGVANAFSHLGAAWLAKRIGLVNTMVFTHIPSSLLLATAAFVPTYPVAAALFMLREGLVEMDVPTRQSYVMAIVRPEERTVASGVTHLVRLGGWAVASAMAGMMMQSVSLWTPIVAGCAMKIAYDVLLYYAFRRTKPPEEAPTARAGAAP